MKMPILFYGGPKVIFHEMVFGLFVLLIVQANFLFAANFTGGSETARKFGVHQISLTGNGGVSNPFRTEAHVTFTPPSGVSGAVSVRAFYDGGNTWRARVYVTETGNWRWNSSSLDPGLNNKNGSFSAINSILRGKLRIHRHNNRQWQTDDGKTFLNLSDTGYIFFNPEVPESDFRDFVRDDWNLGITSIRAGGCGGYSVWKPDARAGADGRYPRDNWCWDVNDTTSPYNYDIFDLVQLKKTDERLEWLLNNYPGMYIQLIMLTKDIVVGNHWYNDMTASQRRGTIEYLISRWAAWPQIFFLIVNDTAFTYSSADNNKKMVREIGNLMVELDPWKTLCSAGPKRREDHPLITASDFSTWHTYLHMERQAVTDGWIVDYYYDDKDIPVHLYYGEDLYEGGSDNIANPDYFNRRLFWSVLLSGGSPNYGGRYKCLHPYSMTGHPDYKYYSSDSDVFSNQLVGLDSVIHIKNFFMGNSIDMAHFVPDDGAAVDLEPAAPEGATGASRAQVARRMDHSEYIVYLTCAANGERSGEGPQSTPDDNDYVDSRAAAGLNPEKTPQVKVDLRPASTQSFRTIWYRAADGVQQSGNTVSGGSWKTFVSPWKGKDAVLYLKVSGVVNEIIVDNDSPGFSLSGSWSTSTSISGYYGSDYRHDGNSGKGGKSARWSPDLPKEGNYHVSIWYPTDGNKATDIPVKVSHSGGVTDLTLDQSINGSQWVSLGTYYFGAGTQGFVEISNLGTDSYVVADAVKFEGSNSSLTAPTGLRIAGY